MVIVQGADRQFNFIALAVFSFVMAIGLFVYLIIGLLFLCLSSHEENIQDYEEG